MKKGNISMIIIGVGAVLVLLVLAAGVWISRKKASEAVANGPVTVKEIPAKTEPDVLQAELNQTADTGMTVTVETPKDGAVTKTARINMTGKTSPGATVEVNDLATTADKDGNFSFKVDLTAGENPLLVIVSDDQGNMGWQEVKVTYEP